VLDLQELEQQSATPTVNVGAWVLPISAGLVFLGLGLVKMFPGDDSTWFHTFDQIGFGRWFMTFTGAVQATAGILLLVPRTTLLGGLLAGVTMVGAMIAQLTVLEGVAGAVVPGAVLAFVVCATLAGRHRNAD
jgi:hypothetical protein